MPEIRLNVKSTADTKALDDAGSKVDQLKGKVDRLALPAAAVGAGLVAGAAYVKDYASTAQQAIGSTEAVFGDYAKNVQNAAATADQALGLSEANYNTLASAIGGSLSQAGYATDELAGKTDDMLRAASDVSAVFGGDVEEAAGAMGAALRGEFDSLERFGVFLNAAAVEAELARTGQDKLTGAALDAAKKQATYNLVLEQAGQYAGTFAKEADTAAGAEQRAAAARENAAAQLGSAVLPMWTQFQVALAGAAQWVAQNTTAVLIVVGVLGTLAATVLAVSAALRVWTAAQAIAKGATVAWTAAQAAFNAVMALNPITLVVLAVLALVAAIVIAYHKVGWFRDLVNAAGAGMAAAWDATTAAMGAAWEWVTSTATSLWEGAMATVEVGTELAGDVIAAVLERVQGAIDVVVDVVDGIGGAFSSAGDVASGALDAVIGTVQRLIGWVEDAVGKIDWLKGIGSGIGSLFGSGGYVRAAVQAPQDGAPFYMTAAQLAPVPAAAFVPSSGTSSTRRTRAVSITINGALDPVATAREIRRILDDEAELTGRLP